MRLDLAPYLDAIEYSMQRAVPPGGPPYDGLYGMLRYHLGWQDEAGLAGSQRRGKRIRPLLCLLSCEAVGGAWQGALPAATAVELIHNFTLIHDDIEDDSPTRHGRRTLWTVWGLAQGINAGDCLWALARGSMYGLQALGHLPEVVLESARLLDRACLRLCEGQYLDISSEGDTGLVQDAYMSLIRGKTAALVSAALTIGCVLGGSDSSTVAAASDFGEAMGLAFQITDDLLGIWGDPAITGKSAASDLLSHKMTFPVIHALSWERERGQRTLHELYSRPPDVDSKALMLSVLERSGAKEATEQRAASFRHDMDRAWNSMNLQGIAAEALYELAQSIIGRQS